MGIVIRQSIKGTFVNYIGAFIGFVTTFFIFTKYLQTEEVGFIGVLYQAALMIANFALMGITASAIRFFPHFKNSENKDNGFFFYLLIPPTIGLIICIPIYLVLKAPISDYFSNGSSLLADYYNWVIPLICIVVYWMTFETYSNLKMRIAVPKFIREVLLRIMHLIVYLLYAFKVLDIDSFVASYILVYGIALLITLLYINKIGNLTLKHDFSFLSKNLRQSIAKYTGVLVLGVLSTGLLYQLELFMVSGELGLNYGGIYWVAFNIGVIVEIPSRSIGAIASPIAAKSLIENNISEANLLYKKVALHQLIAGGLIFLFVWINIDNIFAIMPKGDEYSAGKWVVFFIAISKLVSVTFNFGTTLVSFSKYYYWMLPFSILLTVLGITANLLLIPKLGITGASIAALVTCTVSYVIQQIIILLKLKGNPFSLSLFKFLTLLCVAFALNHILPMWSEYPIVDGLYRTLIVGTISVISLYKLKISEEVCMIINNFFKIK
jgi:Membrane protein involved in the export of O-antigen and teichoic acid